MIIFFATAKGNLCRRVKRGEGLKIKPRFSIAHGVDSGTILPFIEVKRNKTVSTKLNDI